VPVDPLALPTADFTTTADVLRRLAAFLASALVAGDPVNDRRTGTPRQAPAPVLSGVFRFDGYPDEAAGVGLARRDETGDVGKAFALVGFSAATNAQAAASGDALVLALPVDVVLCYPNNGANGTPAGFEDAGTKGLAVQADAEALDVAQDLTAYFLRTRFLPPADLGCSGYRFVGAQGGRLARGDVNYRRLSYVFSLLVACAQAHEFVRPSLLPAHPHRPHHRPRVGRRARPPPGPGCRRDDPRNAPDGPRMEDAPPEGGDDPS